MKFLSERWSEGARGIAAALYKRRERRTSERAPAIVLRGEAQLGVHGTGEVMCLVVYTPPKWTLFGVGENVRLRNSESEEKGSRRRRRKIFINTSRWYFDVVVVGALWACIGRGCRRVKIPLHFFNVKNDERLSALPLCRTQIANWHLIGASQHRHHQIAASDYSWTINSSLAYIVESLDGFMLRSSVSR